ncbi:MAG: YraN family protein [Muribaculaceae bacterium]|jgi:putative endonuclease|nr:YraN family protein [Muribaculaceae bacterium]
MARHNIFGKQGEDVAADYLIKNGYIIRERNWRLDKLEVDIVAEKDRCIVMVEVKTRSYDVQSALLAVDKRKQSFLIRAANAYVKSLEFAYSVRVDVICVVGDGPDNFRIDHIPDAVRPRVRAVRGRRIK